MTEKFRHMGERSDKRKAREERERLGLRVAFLVENNAIREAVAPLIGEVKEIVFNALVVNAEARRRVRKGK